MIEPFIPEREVYLSQQELYSFFDEYRSEKYMHSLKENRHFKYFAKKDKRGHYKYNPYYLIEYKEKYNQVIEEAEDILFCINPNVSKSFLARKLSVKSDIIKSFRTWINFLTDASRRPYKNNFIELKPLPKTILEFCLHGRNLTYSY